MKKPNGKKIDPNLKLVEILPLTKNQEKVFECKNNAVLHGSAGTGKSLISSYIGYKGVLSRKYDALVYVRSAVPTRSIGFLPGTESEKTQVYEAPYREIATELFDRGDAYDTLKNSGVVRFLTTSHIRGINLNNVFVVVDECQNMTFQELDSVMTRIGKGTRIFFCGDYYQKDLKDTGIRQFYNVLRSMDEFDFINFTIDDVVRSEIVKNYLKHKYEKGHFEQQDLSEGRSRISSLLAGKTNIQDPKLHESSDANSYPELHPTKSGHVVDSDRLQESNT
jgi:phosphate starvation-inducible PhoH-like protein